MTTHDSPGGDDFWGQRQAALEAKLDLHLTAQRDAFDGGRRKLTYLEGHACIAQLNRIFGYGGWSYTLDQMGVDECVEGPQEDWYAQFWAVVTLRVGGASRSDLGTAEIRNTKRSGSTVVRNNVRNVDSRATARKGAVTDALKRAARTFGQQFGNGLYDQDDNIYAWMAAHSLCDEEAEAASSSESEEATGQSSALRAAPAAKEGPPSVSETVSKNGSANSEGPSVARASSEHLPRDTDGKPLGDRARALLAEIRAAQSYGDLHGANGLAGRVSAAKKSGDLRDAESAALFDAINKKNQALRVGPHAP